MKSFFILKVFCAKVTQNKSYSIVTDYLGTPTQMFDNEGQNIWDMELDIYGKVRTFKGSSLNDSPFRYQGQYLYQETGLYYNRFRYYDSEVGSYISQDPIGLDGGNPTLYVYVHNVNNLVDPFGLDLVDGAPLDDATQVFRISDQSGIDSFKFNQRELDAIAKGKLDPPGVSVIRANSAEEAMKIWNDAFPTRQVELSAVRGSTAADIRNAGFNVIHNPSKKGKLGDVHARLIHLDGLDGFSDSNLEK